MDKLLKNAESIDLTGNTIFDILNGDVNIYEYKDLSQFSDIDDVLHTHHKAVILYETKEQFGHWVGLFRVDDRTLEFFDPYGLEVDEELNLIGENIRESLGEIIPHLSYLIMESGYDLIQNTTRLQKFLEDVNTCGRHVSVRLNLCHIPLDEYIKLLTTNKCYNADLWVSAMTILF